MKKRTVNLKSRCSWIKSTLLGKSTPPKHRHDRKFSAKGHEVFEQEKSKAPWRRLYNNEQIVEVSLQIPWNFAEFLSGSAGFQPRTAFEFCSGFRDF